MFLNKQVAELSDDRHMLLRRHYLRSRTFEEFLTMIKRTAKHRQPRQVPENWSENIQKLKEDEK